MNSKKRRQKFRGKQVLVVGLIALVLAAGYYPLDYKRCQINAVSVSSTAAPDDAETFWSNNKNDENKDNNDEKQNNSDNNEQQNQDNQK